MGDESRRSPDRPTIASCGGTEHTAGRSCCSEHGRAVNETVVGTATAVVAPAAGGCWRLTAVDASPFRFQTRATDPRENADGPGANQGREAAEGGGRDGFATRKKITVGENRKCARRTWTAEAVRSCLFCFSTRENHVVVIARSRFPARGRSWTGDNATRARLPLWRRTHAYPRRRRRVVDFFSRYHVLGPALFRPPARPPVVTRREEGGCYHRTVAGGSAVRCFCFGRVRSRRVPAALYYNLSLNGTTDQGWHERNLRVSKVARAEPRLVARKRVEFDRSKRRPRKQNYFGLGVKL